MNRAWFFVVLSLLLSAPACKEAYKRPKEKINVGEIADFIGPSRHLQSKGIMIYRDDKGWRALGTRCTYEGCDLTYQSEGYVCSCCGSYFDGQGKSIKRPARVNLPWYLLSVQDGYFFVDSGTEINQEARLNSEELQAAIKEVERIAAESQGKGVTEVPEILRGNSDGEGGVMFVEPKPQDLKERYDIDPVP